MERAPITTTPDAYRYWFSMPVSVLHNNFHLLLLKRRRTAKPFCVITFKLAHGSQSKHARDKNNNVNKQFRQNYKMLTLHASNEAY